MRRLTVVGLSALAAVILWPATAMAKCPAPEITVSPETAVPGGTIIIEGRDFFVGCNDVSENGEPPEPEPPEEDIRIQFVQDSLHEDLGVVSADEDYRFRADFQLPEAARAGSAEIRAIAKDGTVTERITIRSASLPRSLAKTGSSVALAVAGLLASLAGGLTWLLTRRRPQGAAL